MKISERFWAWGLATLWSVCLAVVAFVPEALEGASPEVLLWSPLAIAVAAGVIHACVDLNGRTRVVGVLLYLGISTLIILLLLRWPSVPAFSLAAAAPCAIFVGLVWYSRGRRHIT